jgi:hypothetical protein
MPFLQSPAVLRNWSACHASKLRPTDSQDTQHAKQESLLPSTRSIASLINLVRNPVENVGEIVENWYEGNTKEERAKQQARDEIKQLWYLRLWNVWVPGTGGPVLRC